MRAWLAALASVAVLLLTPAPARAADRAFEAFLQSLWPEAQKQGVSRETFERATLGLEPDLSLPDLVVPGRTIAPPKGQAEFIQTPTEYLRPATLDRLTEQGRRLADTHRATLRDIEKAFGVPGPIILAIWGRETAYGGYRLPHNAIRVLATQAYLGRRKEQFRGEFLLALKMLEEGHAKLSDMRSSWAGAMGQTQFLPSDFYHHAVDFDGDGRRNIWTSVPDALASAAQQLVAKGWQRGGRWAYEVRAPRDIDCTIAEPDTVMPMKAWLARGFHLARDYRPSAGELEESVSLLLPAGIYGPGFLTPRNYFVLKDYNFSDLYVLFVGHLADRIAGGGAFERPWQKVRQIHAADVERMQEKLTALGFYGDKIDGKAGMKTRAAVGAYQKANGLTLDCWPTEAVLRHMGRKK